jgi:hypothetical protein
MKDGILGGAAREVKRPGWRSRFAPRLGFVVEKVGRAKVAELADAPDLGHALPKAVMLKGFRGLRSKFRVGGSVPDAVVSKAFPSHPVERRPTLGHILAKTGSTGWRHRKPPSTDGGHLRTPEDGPPSEMIGSMARVTSDEAARWEPGPRLAPR